MPKLKYIGRGAFLHGIPAWDLSELEVKEHGGVEYLVGTGLYIDDKPKRKKVVKASTAQPKGYVVLDDEK